jgi:hypothetical protein
LSPEFPSIDVYPIVSTCTGTLFREACWHSPKALFLSQYERRMFEYMNSHNFLNAGIFVYLRVFLYRYRISEKGIQYELHRYANTRKKYTLLSAGFVRYVNDTGKGHKQSTSRLIPTLPDFSIFTSSLRKCWEKLCNYLGLIWWGARRLCATSLHELDQGPLSSHEGLSWIMGDSIHSSEPSLYLHQLPCWCSLSFFLCLPSTLNNS